MFMKLQVFSIWKKKINEKDSRIRTHDPGGPVYYAEDLLDGGETILVHIASTPTPKKEPNQFRNCV